jgi:glycosyltransferase involved in cell wall biosynthesis
VICDAGVSVPPTTYGGTERAADLLCRGLASRGHRVDLIAGAGSGYYGGKLFVHVPPTASKVDRAWRKIRFQVLALRAAMKADVVICFGRTDYLRSLFATNVPIIVRFANLVDQDTIDQITNHRQERICFVGVSRDQMKDVRTNVPVHIIHNAVDIDRFEFRKRPESPPYLAFLGRLTRNKGVSLAIQAAKRTGMALRIAGNVPRAEDGAEAYFEKEIRPALDGKIEWIGPVGDAAKNDLLGGATGLLFPIQWREPFANVVVESLACGCPVIGWNRGCIPEAIRHGETGFVVNSMEEMMQAIPRIQSLDRSACRGAVEERFNSEYLVDQYLDVIAAITGVPPRCLDRMA